MRYLIALMLLASVAMAQPSITSVSLSDGTLTITGTSFGTKSPAAPLLWDRVVDLDAYDSYNLSSGDTIPVYTSSPAGGGPGGCSSCPWEDNGRISSGSIVTYGDTSPRTTGGAYYHAAPNGSFMKRNIGEASYFYLSWWHRQSETISGVSHKFLRMWASSSGESALNTRHAWVQNQYFPGDNGILYGSFQGTAGQWNHFEQIIDCRDLDTDTYNEHTAKINGQILSDNHGTAIEDYPSEDDTIGPQTIIWLFGADPSIPGNVPDLECDWTDVYMDTTAARVMYGDASTLANCNHTEVQVPSAWSATSITATSVPGTFASDADVYVYVIDSDENVSAGYLLSLDGSGGEAAVAISSASRTGNTLSVSITAPTTTPADYVVWVAEDDSWRVGYHGPDTSASITVDGTAALRVYVTARDNTGDAISTSAETRIAGS